MNIYVAVGAGMPDMTKHKVFVAGAAVYFGVCADKSKSRFFMIKIDFSGIDAPALRNMTSGAMQIKVFSVNRFGRLPGLSV